MLRGADWYPLDVLALDFFPQGPDATALMPVYYIEGSHRSSGNRSNSDSNSGSGVRVATGALRKDGKQRGQAE